MFVVKYFQDEHDEVGKYVDKNCGLHTNIAQAHKCRDKKEAISLKHTVEQAYASNLVGGAVITPYKP